MLDKNFAPETLDAKFYNNLEASGAFKPSGHGPAYAIMLPPPNVTGSLHMGHAFQQTLMDILIRYHRMCGYNTLWQGGTDHAGIATQMVVERQLKAQDISRHDLGREQFLEKVWEWKKESGDNIARQMRHIGVTIDWSRERFTMDPGMSTAVLEAFVKLYEDGLIYRGERLVNWDPQLQTAVSDLEVEQHEEAGFLWHIKYQIHELPGFIIVATTRPETLFGDVAVAVHPDDPRYQALIGKKVILPIANRAIPVIADTTVDPEFGTGCVKITPAHDFNDYQLGKKHQLPSITVLDCDAKLNNNVPIDYQNLDRFVARDKLIEELASLNMLDKIVDHQIKIPRGDRSGAILEPLLTKQWFVSTAKISQPAIAAVKDGHIKFFPNHWENTYFEWLNKLEDWCISRQIWWGHRIPAWYDAAGKIYVGRNESEIRAKHNLGDIALTQEADVLDTWFSSALWPFSTLGWPAKTPELNTFYPGNVLITGFDIIFFWVARMIMFGLKFTDKIPFQHIYINGLVTDGNGQKMSKTKGNVIDPLDLINGIDLPSLITKRTYGLMQPKLAEEISKATTKEFPQGIPAHGVDALRFAYCQLATPSRYVRFDLQKLTSSKHFCNKIWNAARFVLLNLEGKAQIFDNNSTHSVNKYFISKWQTTKTNLQQHLANYRFDLFAEQIHEFIWGEFCDWYLELTKPLLQNTQEEATTRGALFYLLNEIVIVLSPVMPFITDEIYRIANKTTNSVMLVSYPQTDNDLLEPQVEAEIDTLKQIIIGLRNIRGENKINPANSIVVISNTKHPLLDKYQTFIKALAKVSRIEYSNEPMSFSATAIIGDIQLTVPLAGIIDVKAEQARINKEIVTLQKEYDKLQIKLANENYLSRGPQDSIAKEQLRIQEITSMLQGYKDKLIYFDNI